MISFNLLGNYGRFGNQLFQYAYVRTQAKRLGTQFYCPKWQGDELFNLEDDNERAQISTTTKKYVDHFHGFNEEAIQVKDGTDVAGFFQSDKYFSRNDVLSWYSFKDGLFDAVTKRYSHIDFSKATGLHVRLTDYINPQLSFYLPRQEYFKKALDMVGKDGVVLVFSDDKVLAKKYLSNCSRELIFVDGNTDPEDFFLMTQCKNFICSPSSFSWWASYLNTYKDKKIFIPEFWFLPGGAAYNNDIAVEGWIRLRAHRWYDYYYVKYLPVKILYYYKKSRKALTILKEKGFSGLLRQLQKK
jgi:hypothetical protein